MDLSGTKASLTQNQTINYFSSQVRKHAKEIQVKNPCRLVLSENVAKVAEQKSRLRSNMLQHKFRVTVDKQSYTTSVVP